MHHLLRVGFGLAVQFLVGERSELGGVGLDGGGERVLSFELVKAFRASVSQGRDIGQRVAE
jgi:hypothetical protein